MTPVSTFLAELDERNRTALQRIAVDTACQPDARIGIANLLVLALKNELEATECAAAWIGTTPEIDVKLALARQAGDEAKHYRLIARRLEELGVDAATVDHGAPSPMLDFLASLATTVERVAAGQYAREALAVVRNDEFIRFCAARGDEVTATLYRDVIQPDERHHHELGRGLLRKLAVTHDAQEAARRAARRTL